MKNATFYLLDNDTTIDGLSAVEQLVCEIAAERWRSGKATDRLSHYLSRGRLLWLTPLISAIGVVALVVLIRHPLMPVYIDILRKVVGV